MKKTNLYDLIPDGGIGCNKDLLKLNSISSDLNEDLQACSTLEELNKAASDYMKDCEGDEIDMQFEAGEGDHFKGGVNYLQGSNGAVDIYAEVEVPEGATEDYGYITMRKAVQRVIEEEGLSLKVSFWYDGQESNLEKDADPDEPVYVEIHMADKDIEKVVRKQTRQAKYDAANTRQITFKFNLKTDADILAKLDEVENRQGYIKDLIRNDLK